MTAAGPSRRELLRGALAGGVLVVGVSLAGGAGCANPRARRIRHAESTGELDANLYVTVLASGRIALAMDKAEIGQGVTTCYATLVAEELEVEPGDIDFHFADAEPRYRTSTLEGAPGFAMQATGGSLSTHQGWLPIRRAAAAAREMLVAAAAARWGVPAGECAARAGRVVHDGSGRSAGYGELTRDAAHQGVPGDPPLKPADRYRLIGKSSRRVDARAKVTGSARFGIDVDVPDMVCAHVIHGPTYGARPRVVRADAARGQPGVIGVYDFRWGVAVVADRYWQAARAARAVEVEWGPGATDGLDTAELAAAARGHRDRGAVVSKHGDVDRALRRAGAAALDAIYEAPYLAHAPMEPQNCTARVGGGRAEVWVPCQVPTLIQEAVGAAVGISADRVVVHTTYAGGGFGRRLLGDFAVQAAMIARRVGKPVKMTWTRESDMRGGFYRPAATAIMRGAVDDGRIAGFYYHNLSQAISLHQQEGLIAGQPGWLPHFSRKLTARSLHALFASNTSIDWFATEGASDTPYRVGAGRFEYTPVHTGVPVGAWRSVGHSHTGFAMEGFVDELAHAAGRDPYRFRRDHLADGSREQRVLDAVARLAGWGEPAPAGFGRGIARHTSFGTEVAEVAEAGVVDGRIRVRRVWCAVECGTAVNPDVVRAQIEGAVVFGLSAALDQEITLVAGRVEQGNFDTYPAVRMHECPEITVTILPSDAHPTGVGEPGLPPIAPAVANALFASTGVRLRRMPLQRAWDEREQAS